jgi:hypothetical protein
VETLKTYLDITITASFKEKDLLIYFFSTSETTVSVSKIIISKMENYIP